MMNYKDALNFRNENDPYLEYYLRAARIMEWFQEWQELSDETTSEIYLDMVELLRREEDPYEDVAEELLDDTFNEPDEDGNDNFIPDPDW